MRSFSLGASTTWAPRSKVSRGPFYLWRHWRNRRWLTWNRALWRATRHLSINKIWRRCEIQPKSRLRDNSSSLRDVSDRTTSNRIGKSWIFACFTFVRLRVSGESRLRSCHCTRPDIRQDTSVQLVTAAYCGFVIHLHIWLDLNVSTADKMNKKK